MKLFLRIAAATLSFALLAGLVVAKRHLLTRASPTPPPAPLATAPAKPNPAPPEREPEGFQTPGEQSDFQPDEKYRDYYFVSVSGSKHLPIVEGRDLEPYDGIVGLIERPTPSPTTSPEFTSVPGSKSAPFLDTRDIDRSLLER